MFTGWVYLAIETLSRFLGPHRPDDHGARRYRISPVDGSKIALPTLEQLAFQDREIGMIIHFNIATYIENDGCNGHRHLVPDISLFNPASLSIDNWMESIVAAGGKHATLVAKHNCGFTTWPTQVRFPLLEGKESAYDYAIQNSPMAGIDIPELFTDSAKRHGVGHGFYYSLDYNDYLNVYHFRVNSSDVGPGQVSIAQETYDKIIYAQLEELWSNYGDMVELWFDGGFDDDQKARVQSIMDRLQPNAVVFNGCNVDGTCITKSPIRWIGTEEGHAPEDNWSTGVSNDGGDPTSEYFAPAECDTATYNDGRWFFGANDTARTLSELVDVYHRTVGRNCFLTLGMSPNRDGLVPPDHAAAYKALGDFVSACYDHPIPVTERLDSDGLVFQFDEPTTIDRVVLMEDQTNGQVIRSYGVYGRHGSEWELLSTGKSIGHKKIDLFDSVTVREVKVNCTSVDVPKWRKVSFHNCERP